MSFFGFRPRGTGRIVPEFVTPPAEADRTAELLERIDRAGARLLAALDGQSALEAGDRDDELVDLAIDVARLLGVPLPGPAAPDPVVPVIPGREQP